jgi:hypothetical protein
MSEQSKGNVGQECMGVSAFLDSTITFTAIARITPLGPALQYIYPRLALSSTLLFLQSDTHICEPTC